VTHHRPHCWSEQSKDQSRKDQYWLPVAGEVVKKEQGAKPGGRKKQRSVQESTTVANNLQPTTATKESTSRGTTIDVDHLGCCSSCPCQNNDVSLTYLNKSQHIRIGVIRTNTTPVIRQCTQCICSVVGVFTGIIDPHAINVCVFLDVKQLRVHH